MTPAAPDAPVDTLLIALAQLNPVVGDVASNLALARRARESAGEAGADLVVFPELFLAGYPPEDLVLRPAFQAACHAALETLAAETGVGPAVLIGAPVVDEGRLYNSVLLLAEGRIAAVQHKVNLSRLGAYDETRLFTSGPLPGPMAFKGVRLGVAVGDDIRGEEVAECLAETGAELLIVPAAWPYGRTAYAERDNIAVARVVETKLPLLLVNLVGGQDGLVFDGATFALNADRFLALQFPGFAERVRVARWQRIDGTWRCPSANMADRVEGAAADYAACVLGLRDHVNKNALPGVVLEMTGGIDSALAAALAVDALGPERVHAVMLPDRSTAPETLADAAVVAEALGVNYALLPIAPAAEGLAAALAPVGAGSGREGSDEGASSRLKMRARSVMVASVADLSGALVLAADDKSGLLTGRAAPCRVTGAFNPIKDLYRSEVVRLAQLRNRWKPAEALGPDAAVIPGDVIDAAFAAAPGEEGPDGAPLPPYAALDPILERLVDRAEPVASVIEAGFEAASVARVARLLDAGELARRQAAPGVKVTTGSPGGSRRSPITNRFQEG